MFELFIVVCGVLAFVAVLMIEHNTAKSCKYLKAIMVSQAVLQEQLAAKITVSDIEMAGYDAPEDNKGTAFCVDCRRVVPKKDLLYKIGNWMYMCILGVWLIGDKRNEYKK